MIGQNRLELCKGEMVNALEHYFNEHIFKEPIAISDVTYKTAGMGNDVFEIVFQEQQRPKVEIPDELIQKYSGHVPLSEIEKIREKPVSKLAELQSRGVPVENALTTEVIADLRRE